VDPSDEENEKTIMFRVVWKVWPAIVGLAYFVPVPSDFGSGGGKRMEKSKLSSGGKLMNGGTPRCCQGDHALTCTPEPLF
jgi:hypothetical protein